MAEESNRPVEGSQPAAPLADIDGEASPAKGYVSQSRSLTNHPGEVLPGSPEFREVVERFKRRFERRMNRTLGRDLNSASKRDRFMALAYTIRDEMIDKWIKTQSHYYESNPKRVYYLSLEFLMGRTMGNALLNLGLTEAVRQRPYTVVLLDECEKADPDVMNLFYQVFDKGMLADGEGRVVDFKNTVLIMTSNVGSDAIQRLGGRDDARMRDLVMDAVRAQFRPEFLNRIDEMVVFHRLGHDELASIVGIQLGRLADRLLRRDLSLVVSPAAKAHLGQLGWDPQYGARPLKRAIQKHLEDPISLRLIGGEFLSGDTVFVDLRDGQLAFGKLPPAS